MIETRGLTKRFGTLVAVNGLGLTIERGSMHGFVGPNGAGKTTTIKMLVGLLRNDDGEAFIKGLPAGSTGARKLIGFAPERPCLYGDMTAAEYLIYMGRMSGLSLSDAESRTEELLDWLELADFAGRHVGGFSAGMKQRMGLAQALVHYPELLILDEPTANLDPTGRMMIISKLKELNKKQNITVFISSHILPELEQLVSSVTLINRGKLVMEDRMDAIKQRFTRDWYVIDTSDNKLVAEMMKDKPYIKEMKRDEAGGIHVTCSDENVLMRGLTDIVAQHKLKLNHFGQEHVGLDEIYSESIDRGKSN